MDKETMQHEALARAKSGWSVMNVGTIYSEFQLRGIPASEIKPRENVFTYNAWQALGRQVKKGEKGVKIVSFIPVRDKDTGKESRRPRSTTVFHVTQTESKAN